MSGKFNRDCPIKHGRIRLPSPSLQRAGLRLKLAHQGFCVLFDCRATALVTPKQSEGRSGCDLTVAALSERRYVITRPVGFGGLRPPLQQALDSRKARNVLYLIMRIWTIGHSTRAIDEFISLLEENQIKLLVDVRAFPSSKRYPQFNKDALTESLNAHGIRYEHFPELGGKRKSKPDSHNTAWRNASFRGYADYMEREQFQRGIERLLDVATGSGPTAIMCAEAVWWRCHRSLIADYLKACGAEVLHILGANKVEAHPYTSAARIVDGKLSYR